MQYEEETALLLEWENFKNTSCLIAEPEKVKTTVSPKCSDIYISTKTKIAYLNSPIDLYDIYWKIPILEYHLQQEGVIKKQIKISSTSKEEVAELELKISGQKNISYDVIQQIDNPHARVNKYKDIRKINIGLNTKDLIRYRNKKKGAFYNCFALIIRIKLAEKFKELHVKVFNTGKLEIPGIQTDEMLFLLLEKLIQILQPFIKEKIFYKKDNIDTVLINSNFSCNYIINRNILFDILKDKYKILALFDPCSYPGIQCKFYYNDKKEVQDGVCNCKEKCTSNVKKPKIKKLNKCKIVSFMIFRTGSVLIVGHCNEMILNIIYIFVKNLLLDMDNFHNIFVMEKLKIKKKKEKKKRKKIITVFE